MYSTLLDDEEYDPLLIVYLTTTGAMLQNHTKAQLIAYALKQVVYREFGREAVPFNVLGEVRDSLQTKRELELEKKQAVDEVAALNAVPKVTGAPAVIPVPAPTVTSVTAPVVTPPPPPPPPTTPGPTVPPPPPSATTPTPGGGTKRVRITP